MAWFGWVRTRWAGLSWNWLGSAWFGWAWLDWTWLSWVRFGKAEVSARLGLARIALDWLGLGGFLLVLVGLCLTGLDAARLEWKMLLSAGMSPPGLCWVGLSSVVPSWVRRAGLVTYFCKAWVGSTGIESAPLCSARLGSACFCLTRLGSAGLGCNWYGFLVICCVWLKRTARLGSAC